jgi:hypothetical protein
MRGKFGPGVGKVSVLHLVRVLPRTYQIIFYLWKYHVDHDSRAVERCIRHKAKTAENGNVNVSTR